MNHFRLQAVDSRLATPTELEAAGITEGQIPKDALGNMWGLAAHQVATVKALRFGNAPIVINRAMTGDGKTLAGRFQLFTEKWYTLAMYPTNELAHDQAQSFETLLRDWTPPNWTNKPLEKQLINAREIDEFSFGEYDATRLEKIAELITYPYILTNPDIFHLIMNFTYQQQGKVADLLPTQVARRFQLYIFDEFHLFGVEQTASVLIAMLLLKELTGQAKSPRFLFLSATPQALLTHLAGKVGLSVALIEGEYRHGDAQPAAGYRRILQATDLYLHSGNLRDWVAEHFEDTILPFFVANRPGAKGLIIANSVATAHRIHADLQPLCKQANIHLGINTGLTPKADRSRMFDLLIATSTVDVGVDFKINFLVFESRDAASHLQRLGRLGRHEHDPSGNLFGQFEAHALLPAWTLEGKTKALSGNEPISREDYRIALTENYSPLQQFDGYIRHWAGIQATKVLKELKNPYIHTQYETLRLRLESNYKQLFGNNMVKKYVSLSNEKRGATLAAASSFRGGNVFSALIQDPETDSQQVVSYNLMSLLRQADLQPVAIPEMLAVAQRRGQDIRSLEKTNPLAAYRLLSWRDEPRKISIELDAQLPPERHEVVIEQNRFRILCTGMAELQALNENTYERVWVAFMIPNKDPDLVRRLLRLGYQLELFDFQAAGNLRGTIAFGRDALLLDSVLIRQRDTSTSFIW